MPEKRARRKGGEIVDNRRSFFGSLKRNKKACGRECAPGRAGMRRRTLIGLLKDDRGETAIEYALIAAFVSISIYAGAKTVGVKLSANYYGPVADNPD
jgi:Flp pilus assembly pilin Flp